MLCPGWRDPLNVGAAFRLADAAGLAQLILTDGTPCPPHPKIARTARSCERSVPWLALESGLDFLLNFRRSRPQSVGAGVSDSLLESPKSALSSTTAASDSQAGFVLALEVTSQSQSLFDFSLPPAVISGQQPLCLIAGAEAHGVSQELLDHCDASVHLPMYGQNTSMNVSVALGAAIYLLLDQWQRL